MSSDVATAPGAAASAPKDKPKVSDRTKSERKLAWLLCAPAVIAMLLVTAYPIIYAVVLSLQELDLRFPDEGGFVGFDNYITVLSAPAVVGVGLQHGLHRRGLGRDRARARDDHRPGHVPGALLPRARCAPRCSSRTGSSPWSPPSPGSTPSTRAAASSTTCRSFPTTRPGSATAGARSAVIIAAEVWKTTPFIALLLLAGLTTIDDGLYEAAKVDGASAWQRFWKITLPLMKPAILVAVLFRTLDAFRVFDSIFIMTGGGQDTQSVSIVGYDQLISRVNLGLGSAVSVLIFLHGPADRVRVRARLRDHDSRKGEGGLMKRGTREYTFWSVGMFVIIAAALIPVLWLLSLSLKDPATIADGRLIPSDRHLRQLQVAVRGRPRQPAAEAADQLDRDRADLDHDRDRARLVHRLRDRPPRVPGQAPDPRRRAGDRDVPGDLDRRPAVRHVAEPRPLRHLPRADHPLPDLLAAARRSTSSSPSSGRSPGTSSRRRRSTGRPRSRPSAR